MGVFDGALKTRVQHSHPYEYVGKSIQLPAAGLALNLNNTAGGGTGSLNLAVIGAASGVILSGAEFDGTNSTARAAAATQFEFLNGAFNWFSNSGLTSGSTYTRTKRMALDSSGNLSAIGGAHNVGVGALGATGGYVQIATDTGANIVIYAQHSGSDANLVLRTKGNGGVYFQNAGGTVTPLGVDTTATDQVTITHLNLTGYVSGSPSGYAAELRMGTTSAASLAITSQATGSPQMSFDHRGTSNTGYFIWRSGTSAGTTLMQLGTTGNLSAVGQDHKFGGGAFSGSAAYLEIQDDGTNTYLTTSGVTNGAVLVRSRGTGLVSLAAFGASNALSAGASGTTPILGFFGAAGAPIVQPTASGSRGGNAALASLVTALANLGLINNATTV